MKNINNISRKLNDYMDIENVVRYDENLEDIQFDIETNLLDKVTQLEERIDNMDGGSTNSQIQASQVIMNDGTNLQDEHDSTITWIEEIEAIAYGNKADVGEALNVAYSKQSRTDENLATNSKDLVGAINELFQSANNGKELIANAIGEPVSSEDTFQAMSNDINNLLSTFKTNLMNNGVAVEAGDKFKSLIEKIKGLTEGEGNKGIKFAEGVITAENTEIEYSGSIIPLPSGYFLNTNIGFKPNLLFIMPTSFAEPEYTYNRNYIFFSGGSQFLKLHLTAYDYDNHQFEYILTDIDDTTNYIKDNGDIRISCGSYYGRETYKYYAIGVGEIGDDPALLESLKSILTEEGVSTSDSDTMASLITKVDEEFDNKKLNLVNALTAKGFNVSIQDSYDTLINNIYSLIKHSNFWIAKTEVPVNIGRSHDVTSIGDYVYIVGASAGGTRSAKVYRFSTTNETWEALPDLPMATSFHSIASAGEIIYVFHASSNGQVTDACYSYDPALNTWTSIKSSPVTRYSCSCNTVNGKIYLICGYSGGEVNYNYCYDPATNTWTSKTNASYATYDHMYAALGNNIHILGGYSGGAKVSYHAVYDTTLNSWSYQAFMGVNVVNGTAAALNGKIYMIGGDTEDDVTHEVICYDSSAGSWSDAIGLPSPLQYSRSTTCNNAIYVLGGGTSALHMSSKVHYCYKD